MHKPTWGYWLALASILVGCIGCDQWTKQIAQERLKGQPPQSMLGDVLRLEYAENPGAFLGLGGEMSVAVRWTMLVGVNGVLAAAIGIFLARQKSRSVVQLVGCALLLGGAVGNLIDRLWFDCTVIDFLNLGVGPLRTGIFNVADMAIMAGGTLLVWHSYAPSGPRAAAETSQPT